jgi:hypothetical protein
MIGRLRNALAPLKKNFLFERKILAAVDDRVRAAKIAPEKSFRVQPDGEAARHEGVFSADKSGRLVWVV